MNLLSNDTLIDALRYLSCSDLDSLPLVNRRLQCLLTSSNSLFETSLAQRRVLIQVRLDSFHDYFTRSVGQQHWFVGVEQGLTEAHDRLFAHLRLCEKHVNER